MSEHEPVADVPTPQEVRTALQRIVTSDVFRSSPQIVSFLKFVVEAVLHGNGDRIKGYTIGVEVLHRDIKFDPQLDPIVRVEATRLRRALERYYTGSGLNDPVIIGLPRGSYVPTFNQRRKILENPENGTPRLTGGLRLAAASTGLILIVIAAISVWLVLAHRSTPTVVGPADGERFSPGNGMPVLFVRPFNVAGTPGPRSISATSLYARLTDAFSHFDLVNIQWQPADGTAATQQSGHQSGPQAQIDYRLIGSVQYDGDGAARMRFELVDTADNNLVWSQVFEHIAATNDRAGAEDAVVRQLAETLVQPFGVIYSDGRNKSLRTQQSDPRYRCVLESAESFRSFIPSQQSQARKCLERFTSIDPNFGIGFTYLAAIDLREYQYRLDARTNELPSLDRALKAAQRGVKLNPESSRAYEILFVVLFARGDLAAAFTAGDTAIKLNKYDMRSLGAYGARLIAKGDIDGGLALLARAEEDGRIIPAFEQFFLFLGNYMRADMERAAFHADQITEESFQLGLIARALVAFTNDDRDTAHKYLDRLVALNPGWRDDLRGRLGRFFQANSIIDRLARDLTAAGLTNIP